MVGVLTDEQIATMSPRERRDLITRLSQPVDELVPSKHWLRRTRELRLAVLTLSTLALIPWIVYLTATLPHTYVARHWDASWVGFDVLLLGMMLATAVLSYLRRQLLMMTAFATGVLLVCDAWFDVMTAGSSDVGRSVLTALVVELPFAVVLIAGSLQMMRLTSARLWSLSPGQHAWQIRVPLPNDGDTAVGRRGRSARRGRA